MSLWRLKWYTNCDLFFNREAVLWKFEWRNSYTIEAPVWRMPHCSRCSGLLTVQRCISNATSPCAEVNWSVEWFSISISLRMWVIKWHSTFTTCCVWRIVTYNYSRSLYEKMLFASQIVKVSTFWRMKILAVNVTYWFNFHIILNV